MFIGPLVYFRIVKKILLDQRAIFALRDITEIQQMERLVDHANAQVLKETMQVPKLQNIF